LATRVHEVDIFIEGRSLTWDTVSMIEEFVTPFCELRIHDISDAEERRLALKYNVNTIPAIFVNGKRVYVERSASDIEMSEQDDTDAGNMMSN